MAGSLLASSQKGSMLLTEIRKKYPNYHPIMAIVEIAMDDDAPLELQFNCHKTVAKYIEPELKSVEVKGELKTVQTVRVSLFDEAVARQEAEAEEVSYRESLPVSDSQSLLGLSSFGLGQNEIADF